jgi:carboxylate-amine ligase
MEAGIEIAASFDAVAPLTIGLEEELMLLDVESLDLAPSVDSALELLGPDERFKRELPASQLESITTPCATAGEAVSQLVAARMDLSARLDGHFALAASGTHPFAAPLGALNRGEHYDAVAARFVDVARRQQVFALQIHVAPGSADTALAIYNALRGYLPELAALAANSPFHGGADTAHASWRARIAELLPRQGIPPALRDWDDYAAQLDWGVASGALSAPGGWWWELRPHTSLGTLELRVPDAQTTLDDAAAIVAVGHCLVKWLADRHRDGEDLGVPATWRIAENRWMAVRDGLDARLVDLEDGAITPARERIATLLASLAPVARELGCSAELGQAEALLEENGAERQRRVEHDVGIAGLVAWMRDEFAGASAG